MRGRRGGDVPASVGVGSVGVRLRAKVSGWLGGVVGDGSVSAGLEAIEQAFLDRGRYVE
jgi:uncharacterized protein YidB (DUF937 family)